MEQKIFRIKPENQQENRSAPENTYSPATSPESNQRIMMTEIKPDTLKQQPVKEKLVDQLLYIVIKYKTALIITLALIITAGAGIFFWIRYQDTSEKEAALHLSRIAPLVDLGQYRAAIDGDSKIPGLKKIDEKYGHVLSGKMAGLLLANTYYALRQPDSALTVFNRLSFNNKDLSAAALAGSGDCYTEKKQFDNAAKAYEKAAETAENSTLKAQYLASAADSYLATKDVKKASDFYTRIIADYPGSTGAILSQRALWQISGQQ
jgi:tetratricopeptide (TPR) repeat protein